MGVRYVLMLGELAVFILSLLLTSSIFVRSNIRIFVYAKL
jgi:hypothetical protein